MERFEELVRARRTHKAFRPEPVPRETLLELLDLARHAPNHHLTEPWRFRVLGPEALARLKEAAGEKEAAKLERAPTLVLVTARLSGDLVSDEEDLHAAAAAVTILLLAAQARGLASYWRTPGILRSRPGRAALRIPDGERVVALVNLGYPERQPAARARGRLEDVVSFLD